MKIAALSIVSVGLTGLLLACSSSSTTGTGSGSGSSCAPANGTYKVHYVKDAASTGVSCVDIADSTLTISPSDGGSTAANTPPGCTVTGPDSSCSVTTKCSQTSSGLTIDTTNTYKLNSDGSVSGSQATKTSGGTGPTASANSDCKYTYTWTKQ